MQDSRINRDANAAKSRNWRERNDRVQRFLSSLDNQSTINHRRRAGAGRINDINPRTSFSGRASANTNLRSTGSRSSSSNNESSSSVRNRRIGTTGFSSNKQTNAKRLTTADFLRMQVDGDHNGSISLEEILLYVIDRKSKNQQIPQAMYSVHRKFADVVESLELIDNDESLDIEDGEAARAIISRRANQLGNSLDMEVVDFVLNYLNDNIDGIDAAAQTIDTNPDGAVSNIEVLTALLAERRGELDTSDPNIDAVLRTNDSYDQLVALVASMSGDFDGVVSDEQAFDIILALRASNPGDTLLQQALFLGTNDNLAEIEASVAVFDSLADGQISNEEFITVIKEMRAGNLSEEDHQIAMNILRAREPYASILNLIEAIDTEVDGSISDDEVIDFTLASLRGEFDLDTSLVETIINSNNKVDEIRNLINQIDTETANPGSISEDEFIQAATELLADNGIGPASKALIEKIISRNPNSAAIYQILDFIDSNDDKTIAREEAINALLAQDRGETSELNQSIFDKILNLNSERAAIEAILDQINPARDGNPSLAQSFDFILEFKAGNITGDETLIRDIIAAFPQAQAILETYELMDQGNNGIDLREYTTGLMQINKGLASNPGTEIMAQFTEHVQGADIVNEGIATLDSIETNGRVSAEEFYQNFNQLFLRADNTVDMDKLDVFMTVADIIFPAGDALFQFIQDVDTRVETPVNIISDTEVIDAILNLNNESIADPGAEIVDLVLSRNPNKVALSNLVQAIDADNDGEINNIELTQNLLKFRRGEFTEEPGLVQYLLNKSPKFAEVSALVDAFDKDANGEVSNLELFAELFANRTGDYAGLTDTETAAIITRLKATNNSSAAITAAVAALDPDASGDVSYDEIVSAYLAINSGTQADFSDELKQAIPKVGGDTFGQSALDADQLVDLFDTNTDGSISDMEVAMMLLSDRANNTLSNYEPELVDAIFRSNGNKDHIEALIDRLAGADGVIDRSELISTIMSQRADSNSFGADYPMVEAILEASNSDFAAVKSLIGQIDTSGQGEISDQEAVNTLVAIGKADLKAEDIELANAIIDANPDIAAIRTAFTNFDIDFGSDNLTIELFETWVAIQQGAIQPDYFDELIAAFGPGSDISNLISQFQEIDTSGDNSIDTDEFGQLIIDIVTGNKVQADYQILIDVLSADPDLAAISNVINSFNPDGDNNFSDENILEGLLALNAAGTPELINEGYVQAILAQNPDSAGIIKLVSVLDPSQSGEIGGADISRVWDAVNEEIRSIPQDLAYDFNGDGVVNNKDKFTVLNVQSYLRGFEFTVRH